MFSPYVPEPEVPEPEVPEPEDDKIMSSAHSSANASSSVV
jgi:hypothetical protein